mmetsp:Transcript_1416/g.3068  ORF Transcript_1416/g.3068 Transcript_1416/m.3068 type:complete len:107 (-) Transcript_1416:300-620(-)
MHTAGAAAWKSTPNPKSTRAFVETGASAELSSAARLRLSLVQQKMQHGKAMYKAAIAMHEAAIATHAAAIDIIETAERQLGAIDTGANGGAFIQHTQQTEGNAQAV